MSDQALAGPLALARALAERSAERYADLADAFAVSNNTETAEAFRRLAERSMERATVLPPGPAAEDPWGDDTPAIADVDAVHYLMLPWHAFDLALRHEEKGVALLSGSAWLPWQQEMAAWVADQRGREPEPLPGWDEDPDPPNWDM